MKPALFNAWVGALNKPDVWRQMQGEFEVDGCYCAMGVLLRVDRWTKGLKRVVQNGQAYYTLNGGHRMWAAVHDEYLETIGLDREIADQVLNMNDSSWHSGESTRPATFPEIAAYLKEKQDVIVTT